MKWVTARESDTHRWPDYLFWGRMRMSTFVLLLAFFGTWSVYQAYRPPEVPPAPSTQVVPPGFVPDPAYTWVPRTNVQQRSTSAPTTKRSEPTSTEPKTTAETTSPTSPTPTTPSPLPPGASVAPTATTTAPVPAPMPFPIPLPPWATPQPTVENRSGSPTTAPAPVPAVPSPPPAAAASVP